MHLEISICLVEGLEVSRAKGLVLIKHAILFIVILKICTHNININQITFGIQVRQVFK